MKVGDTFFDPGSGLIPHLFVVVAKSATRVLAYNVTSHHPGVSDETCTVQIGDHPFITHPSVVNYREGRYFDEAVLDDAIKNGLRKGHDACPPELLTRIRQGALVSRYTPQGQKEVLLKLGVRRPGLTVTTKRRIKL